jgi:hypothetical protein
MNKRLGRFGVIDDSLSFLDKEQVDECAEEYDYPYVDESEYEDLIDDLEMFNQVASASR